MVSGHQLEVRTRGTPKTLIWSDTFIAEKLERERFYKFRRTLRTSLVWSKKGYFWTKRFILTFLDAEFSRGDNDNDNDQTWRASELVTRQRWWLQIFQAPLCAAQWFIIERRQSSPLLTIARNIDLKKTPKSQKIFSHSFCSFTEALSGEKKQGKVFTVWKSFLFACC